MLDRLGPRERDVLALVAQGWSNAGVARELHLSERTVEATASSVFRKMGLTASPTTNRRVLAVLAYLGCEATVPPVVRRQGKSTGSTASQKSSVRPVEPLTKPRKVTVSSSGSSGVPPVVDEDLARASDRGCAPTALPVLSS